MSTKDKPGLVESLLAQRQQTLAPVLKELDLEAGCGNALLPILVPGWLLDKHHICVHPALRPDADSIAAFLTFIRLRYSMFEARQMGEKLDEAGPILKDLHFTNIQSYVSPPKKTSRPIYHSFTNISCNSFCISQGGYNYECREVDSGTRYLRRSLVGRTSQEKLLGIIVFRTINRSSLLFLSLAQVKSRQLELNLNQLLS